MLNYNLFGYEIVFLAIFQLMPSPHLKKEDVPIFFVNFLRKVADSTECEPEIVVMLGVFILIIFLELF